MALVVKNQPVNAGDTRDEGSIPGLGRSPGEGNGNPLQYSCLKSPVDRGAWWATVRGITKSWTRLKRLGMHVCVCRLFAIAHQWTLGLFYTFVIMNSATVNIRIQVPPQDCDSIFFR